MGCEFVLVTNIDVRLVAVMIKKKRCFLVELIYVVDSTYRQRYRATIFKVTLVFLLLTLNVFASLIFGLADYLVWLAEKSLDTFISRQIRDH